jgi:hypothetical protein
MPSSNGHQLIEKHSRIKDEIASAGMLHNLDYKLPIIVRTDASTRGVGAVLCQRDGNRWKNVAFVSKRFTGAATRWSTIDQESFAIFFALKSWKTLLQGHKFIVETDHKNIVHIMGSTEGRLARWRLQLQELDFSVHHIPGKENTIADALSRCLVVVDKEEEIRKVHGSIIGHHGVSRTVKMLKENGTVWPKMRQDVVQFIRS